MHRDPYRAELGAPILARVPPDLDALNEEVVAAACERLSLHVEPHAGHVFSIELGNHALVDSLPGVPGGTSFLGTFDREEALADERIDFFAAGHPLVEGVLAHLEESPLGRAAVLRVALGAEKGLGLLALYKDGAVFEAVAVDAAGRPRPDWAAALRRRPLRTGALRRGCCGSPAGRRRCAGWRRRSTRRADRWRSRPSSSALTGAEALLAGDREQVDLEDERRVRGDRAAVPGCRRRATGGIVSRRLPPTFIPGTPWSQPAMTWPVAEPEAERLVRGRTSCRTWCRS